MAIPIYFLGPFSCNIFFRPVTLKECLSLKLRCVSWIQQKDGSYFHIHFVSLCLLTGALRPLILRDSNY